MDNQEKDISLVEEYNQQGRVLYSLDKYEEAIPYYIKAEEEEPTYIQTCLLYTSDAADEL